MNLDLLVVRVAPDRADAVAASIAREVRAAADGVRYVQVRPFTDLIDPQVRAWTLGASMFSAFGLLALVIAAIGLYAVLAFNVAQRTHEIGVRAALGAAPRAVVSLVVGQAARLVAASLLAGIAAALIAGRWLEPLLYGVEPTDLAVLGTVVALLFSVGLVAAFVPASRAARVDPVRALRVD